ncbi:intradiol ring-cleavage dioxygenase [Bradyrhizobium sp. CCBAU 11386]|uniref:intradiol ring-cleavage dioxygenase n=1 Tax=Bradyrhizobium sp. CCBAU 11386 TaxID=1630837 RepID=UPI002303ADE1|nr:intradiol ring-cleavage dioxygenase [Bradyrhizobium sp. CCBAU 11386]MDA9508535.1 intradiol ring-cleavage dioxygenase [Bradyrhizobium sp. CCBAU 11386]
MSTSTRRGFLGFVSVSAAGLLPGRVEASPAATDGEPACILTPQAEEGPFYSDPKLVRSDIAEGKPGVPLSLKLRVIEAGPCTAIKGARVDIWHCDAKGLYSAFPGQGDAHNNDATSKTFLRGTQITDEAGWVVFNTIYPGWYDGRTTHIHFKVFLDDRTVLTGQTFLPDALNEFIYTNVPDYGDRVRQRMVINANDHVIERADPEHRAFCAVKEERDRYVATLTLGVDRRTDATVGRAGPPPPGMRGGPPPGPPPSGMGRPMFGRPIRDRLAALVPGLKPRR